MAAIDEDIVIVGGGIAGLCTALALHRLGLRSLVLESSESYRVTGGALSIWKNGWKALDVLGVADSLRSQYCPHSRMVEISATLGVQLAATPCRENEARCVRRRVLLETLAKELPSDSVRFSSKVDSIENSGYKKLLHLADGSILTTKVVIGCDGVNSVVARWLGFNKPSYTNRMGIRAFVDLGEPHGLEPDFNQIYGNGWRSGFIHCDDTSVCWFFTWCPSDQDIKEEIKDKPMKLKEHVLNALEGQPEKIKDVIKKTKLEDIACGRLGHRLPWEILLGDISKENVCVVGDAFHPMVPDLGQGACSALEDGIILARCLAEAFETGDHHHYKSLNENQQEEECRKAIEMSLNKYAKLRKWRAIDLIVGSYIMGYLLQGDGKVMRFLRDKVLAPFLTPTLFNKADFDCGSLPLKFPQTT